MSLMAVITDRVYVYRNSGVRFRKNAQDIPNAQNQIQIFPILLTNFIGTLGFSIVLPFLVFLVKDFGGNAIVFGILSAIYPAFQLIGAPILGRWSDTYGRKKILQVMQVP
jgi:MFS transporter, DHA1 family, tetracycline resistance protein